LDKEYIINYTSCLGEDKDWLKEVNSKNKNFSGKYGSNICCFKAYANVGNLYYKVHCIKDKLDYSKEQEKNDNSDENVAEWLPEVKNNDSYAGIYDRPIDGIAIKSDSFQLMYRVHLKGYEKGHWLEWVVDYDINNSEYGYAGILGKEIDGIQIIPIQKCIPEEN